MFYLSTLSLLEASASNLSGITRAAAAALQQGLHTCSAATGQPAAVTPTPEPGLSHLDASTFPTSVIRRLDRQLRRSHPTRAISGCRFPSSARAHSGCAAHDARLCATEGLFTHAPYRSLAPWHVPCADWVTWHRALFSTRPAVTRSIEAQLDRLQKRHEELSSSLSGDEGAQLSPAQLKATNKELRDLAPIVSLHQALQQTKKEVRRAERLLCQCFLCTYYVHYAVNSRRQLTWIAGCAACGPCTHGGFSYTHSPLPRPSFK